MKKMNKTNFPALILAIMLLAVVFFYKDDMMAYNEALEQRDALANSIATSIRNGESLDQSLLETEEARIDESIQLLADSTDLGEILARNDQNTETRSYNSLIFGGFGLILIFLITVIAMNAIRMVWNTVWMIQNLFGKGVGYLSTKKLRKNQNVQ